MKLCACGCGQEKRGRGQYRPGHRPKETVNQRAAVCACGCGEPLPQSRAGRYYAAEFRPGHNMRGGTARRPRYQPTPEEIPSGICECGCGETTPICDQTFRRYRWFKGHPRPYVPGHAKHGSRPKRTPADSHIIRGASSGSPLLSPVQVGYLAGILDGEGSIQIRGTTVTVSIANTSDALIAWLLQLGGASYPQKTAEGRRPVWRWQLRMRTAVHALLQQVEPHLIVKRERAQQALAMIDSLPYRQSA